MSSCRECFILHSAIDQVPHNPEIAQLFRQDSERLEEAFTRLWSVPGEGELTDRRMTCGRLPDIYIMRDMR